jgi:hypothetical protein
LLSPQKVRPALARALDDAARTLYADWDRVAGDCVATLRLYTGRHPDDPQLTEPIGELAVHSDTFRRMWADRDRPGQPDRRPPPPPRHPLRSSSGRRVRAGETPLKIPVALSSAR